MFMKTRTMLIYYKKQYKLCRVVHRIKSTAYHQIQLYLKDLKPGHLRQAVYNPVSEEKKSF